MKIGSIVVKSRNFEKMLAFWQEALHYVPEAPVKDGFVILKDPEERGPNISLDKTIEHERVGSTKNPRLHLDLYVADQEA